FFGDEARMDFESELGKGTKVTLLFPGCARQYQEEKAVENAAAASAASEKAAGERPERVGGDLVHKGGAGLQAELVDLIKQGEREELRHE
ncbi:MAG: hypothetical protein IKV48_01695, partial [Eggerthellaceae bacterium]|nr:hypothetical protein [Eggerthellaceae bacterium]